MLVSTRRAGARSDFTLVALEALVGTSPSPRRTRYAVNSSPNSPAERNRASAANLAPSQPGLGRAPLPPDAPRRTRSSLGSRRYKPRWAFPPGRPQGVPTLRPARSSRHLGGPHEPWKLGAELVCQHHCYCFCSFRQCVFTFAYICSKFYEKHSELIGETLEHLQGIAYSLAGVVGSGKTNEE